MARLRKNPVAEEILVKSEFVLRKPQIISFVSSKEILENKTKLILEIGMGKGQFILKQAEVHQENNYLGVEKSSTIILQALNKLLRYNQEHQDKIKNLKFLTLDASELENYFPPNSVSGIYLNFSDPWPKERHQKRRLLHENFLVKYYNILQDDCFLEFKTDQKQLFEFALEQVKNHSKFKILEQQNNLHQTKKNIITTEYEDKFVKLHHKIYFLKLIKK